MKLRDGQLDQAQLTMAEISTIKESLIFSLSNMLHGRVAYKPNEDHLQNQQIQQSLNLAAIQDLSLAWIAD